MLKSICTRCGKLTPYGEKCECSIERNKSYDRYYDKEIRRKRDLHLTNFYHSKEWQAMQAFIMAKYNGIDIYSYYTKQEIVPAGIVHHIIPLRDDWDLRLTENNLIPVSARNHNEIEALYKTKSKKEVQALLAQLVSKWDAEHRG